MAAVLTAADLVGVREAARLARKAGPPVHDDLVDREFHALALNVVWLTDITEHPTAWIPSVVATGVGSW